MYKNFSFIIHLVLVLLFFVSCGENVQKKQTKPEDKAANESKPKLDVSPLPANVFRMLYDECDYMDVIFENLPFSLSQDGNENVRQLLSHVDNKVPASINNNCVPLGHQIYLKEGEILLEADFFVSPGCIYFLFDVDGKKYYNNMMPSGINFYENLKKQKFGN